MRAREVHRTNAKLGGGRGPVVSICISTGLLLGASALHAQLSRNVVTSAEQTARDDERRRILRDELSKSEALLETLVRRKAERLAAADTAGADDAEQQRVRTLSDIAGLKREIASTPRARAEAPSPQLAGAGRPARPSAARTTATSPWWDVYGKFRQPALAPTPGATPPLEAGAHRASAHRLE